VRYKRSVLGVLWTMLNPLLMMIVFSVVFAKVFRFTFEHFTIYFLSAFLLWNFVSQTTSWSTACLLGYAPLIRKIYVPKAIFILATVLSGLVNLLISLIPLAMIMVVVRHPIHASVLFLPLSILLPRCSRWVYRFCWRESASSSTTSCRSTRPAARVDVPDAHRLPARRRAERYRWVIAANPLYPLVETFRAPIYAGVLPDGATVLRAAVWALAVLIVGWWVFERRSDRIAYLV